MKNKITIALSKGRIYTETLPILAHAGIVPADDPVKSRKLILDTNKDDIKLLVLRATDVPVFVQYGAADMGISGKDVITEHGAEGLYEPIDLKIAGCKMMVAAPPGTDLNPNRRLRVATKFVNTARQWFSSQGQQVEIIKLYGAMELAPLVGLADCIVDIVDTGGTLKANGLVPIQHIADISSRLVVNKASMKMKHAVVKPLLDKIEQGVAQI